MTDWVIAWEQRGNKKKELPPPLPCSVVSEPSWPLDVNVDARKREEIFNKIIHRWRMKSMYTWTSGFKVDIHKICPSVKSKSDGDWNIMHKIMIRFTNGKQTALMYAWVSGLSLQESWRADIPNDKWMFRVYTSLKTQVWTCGNRPWIIFRAMCKLEDLPMWECTCVISLLNTHNLLERWGGWEGVGVSGGGGEYTNIFLLNLYPVSVAKPGFDMLCVFME